MGFRWRLYSGSGFGRGRFRRRDQYDYWPGDTSVVNLRKGIAIGLATLGFCGLLSIFAVEFQYYRTMPRQAQPETGRVHEFRALRTPIYVTEREIRIAETARYLATLGFVMFALGAYLLTPRVQGVPRL